MVKCIERGDTELCVPDEIPFDYYDPNAWIAEYNRNLPRESLEVLAEKLFIEIVGSDAWKVGDEQETIRETFRLAEAFLKVKEDRAKSPDMEYTVTTHDAHEDRGGRA
jgi:hypothetical protein